MGITPLTNLLPLSPARSILAVLEPLPMPAIDNSSRTGDETYSPNSGDSSPDSGHPRAAEDAMEEDSATSESELNPATAAEAGGRILSKPIDFFV